MAGRSPQRPRATLHGRRGDSAAPYHSIHQARVPASGKARSRGPTCAMREVSPTCGGVVHLYLEGIPGRGHRLRIGWRVVSGSLDPSPPALCRGNGGLGTRRGSRQTLFPRHKAGGMRESFFGRSSVRPPRCGTTGSESGGPARFSEETRPPANRMPQSGGGRRLREGSPELAWVDLRVDPQSPSFRWYSWKSTEAYMAMNSSVWATRLRSDSTS